MYLENVYWTRSSLEWYWILTDSTLLVLMHDDFFTVAQHIYHVTIILHYANENLYWSTLGSLAMKLLHVYFVIQREELGGYHQP